MSDHISDRTYARHVPGAICEGVFAATIWAAPDVAAKNLDAGALEITLITMAPGVALLISLFLGRFIDSGSRRQLFLWPAFLGRLPIFLLLWFADPYIFIGLLFLQSLSSMPVTAALNAILRSNYSDEDRGLLFGRAVRWSSLFSGLAFLGFGFWLEEQPTSFQIFYPLAAVFGIIACIIYSGLPSRREKPRRVAAAQPQGMFTINLLFRDSVFLRFELAFFLYGLGFMSAMTAKPLFAADVLELGNDEMLGARALEALMLVICTPFMGRMITRFNPAGVAGVTFLLLTVYAALLYFAESSVGYWAAAAVFGIALSGVAIAWNLGPVTLAPEGFAGRYMAVHVSLVGFRALIGHPLGGFIAHHNPRLVFPLSCVFFLAGGLLMLSTHGRVRKRIQELRAQES